jgi:hypothetical protein
MKCQLCKQNQGADIIYKEDLPGEMIHMAPDSEELEICEGCDEMIYTLQLLREALRASQFENMLHHGANKEVVH